MKNQNNYILIEKENPQTLLTIQYKFEFTGNGLMDEKEFRQWIQRIQSLQEETVSPSTSQNTDTDDDVTQDLIAAFR